MKQKTGHKILEAYENNRKLSPEEKEYVGLRLAYPEKFWKPQAAIIIRTKHGCLRNTLRNWNLLCARMRKNVPFWKIFFSSVYNKDLLLFQRKHGILILNLL